MIDSDVGESRRRPGRPRSAGNRGTAGDALILKAAMSAFAEKGFSGTTVREVAGACGVDPALISHHFGSKLGLWQAVVDQHAGVVLAAMEKASSDAVGGTAGARLRSIISAFINIAADNHSVSFFLLRELIDQTDRQRYRYLNSMMMNPIKSSIFPYIEDAIRNGDIKDFDPDYLFVCITSSVVSAYVALVNSKTQMKTDDPITEYVAKISATIFLMIQK